MRHFKQCRVYANGWRSYCRWKLCLAWICLFTLFGNVMPSVLNSWFKAYKRCMEKFFLDPLLFARNFFLVVKFKNKMFFRFSQIILNKVLFTFYSQTTKHSLGSSLYHYLIYSDSCPRALVGLSLPCIWIRHLFNSKILKWMIFELFVIEFFSFFKIFCLDKTIKIFYIYIFLVWIK